MPLLDHFHAPLFPTHRWESFHAYWASAIGEALNRVLPHRYFAEVHVHLGNRVEADVAEFEQQREPDEGTNGPAGGVAVQPWAPPVANHTLPAVFPDDIEVQVMDQRDDACLVAVVELISPGNKDRTDKQRAFAAKMAGYLQRGIGLVVADIVTSRGVNLHDEFVTVMSLDERFRFNPETNLYATAYRPIRRKEINQIDVWAIPLAVGRALPQLPLALRGAGVVPLDLETTYTEARQRSRL
jgi:hypothetical protein